jgi:hypothetical protein
MTEAGEGRAPRGGGRCGHRAGRPGPARAVNATEPTRGVLRCGLCRWSGGRCHSRRCSPPPPTRLRRWRPSLPSSSCSSAARSASSRTPMEGRQAAVLAGSSADLGRNLGWLAFLAVRRALSVERFDTVHSPAYDEHWGEISPSHADFVPRLLRRTSPGGLVLDAACGTGKYWLVLLAAGMQVLGVDQSAGMLASPDEAPLRPDPASLPAGPLVQRRPGRPVQRTAVHRRPREHRTGAAATTSTPPEMTSATRWTPADCHR